MNGINLDNLAFQYLLGSFIGILLIGLYLMALGIHRMIEAMRKI